LLVGAVALAAVVAAPGNALATAPLYHVKIEGTIPDVDLCGFVGTVHITGVEVFSYTESTNTGKFIDEINEVFTTTDGKSVVIHEAGQLTRTNGVTGDVFTGVVNYIGLPVKISARGVGGTEVRDAGYLTQIVTINLVTGEVTDELVFKGPHSGATNDMGIFCDAVAAVLT